MLDQLTEVLQQMMDNQTSGARSGVVCVNARPVKRHLFV
jgi:hypothetical protein